MNKNIRNQATHSTITIIILSMTLLSCETEDGDKINVDNSIEHEVQSTTRARRPNNTSSNLVKNPSFEDRQIGTECPIGPWNTPNSSQGFPKNWTYGIRSTLFDGGGNEVISTPDFLQECSPLNSGYNPQNHIYGSQTPRSGESMGGLITANPFAFGGTSSEYFIQELEIPLIMGREYIVSFYVSLADDSEYTSNGLGIYFTKNYSELVIDDYPMNYAHLTPQIPKDFPGPEISNHTGWTKISGIISPIETGLKYMVLGDFLGKSASELSTNSVGSDNDKAYYYVDDVVVEPVGAPICPIASDLSILEAEPCLDFQVYLRNAKDIASVDWLYSIGSNINVPFGTSQNLTGSNWIYGSLSLNSNNWENYFLVVKANITLTDGSTCQIWTRTLLDECRSLTPY